MNNSEICIKAAKVIDSGQHWASCMALEDVGASESLIERYQALFANREDGNRDVPWLSAQEIGNQCGRAQGRVRVLMLCFMAAISARPR